MRDLVIHDNDVVLGTHGRSLWILDDITPLRQIAEAAAAGSAYLYKPAAAYQIPRNAFPDRSLPLDIPAGQNPPHGAIIDYNLKTAAAGPVTLEIFDSTDKLVRRYSSADAPTLVNPDELNFPTYWLRPPRVLSAQVGMHRFVWDLRYPKPNVLHPQMPAVVLHDTPMGPEGPVVLPGRYTVKLTADGHTYVQPLTVRMDPRVKTPLAGLTQQFDLAMELSQDMNRTYAALQQAKAKGEKTDALLKLNADLGTAYRDIYGGMYGGGSARATPTTQQVSAVAHLHRQVIAMLGQ